MSRSINKKILRLAYTIKSKATGDFEPLDFYTAPCSDGSLVIADMYPAEGHPSAIDFFFFVCMQHYGIWWGDDLGFDSPAHGRINGIDYQGSELLWRLAMRGLEVDPKMFSPSRLSAMTYGEFEMLLSDDHGVPLPNIGDRYNLTLEYSRGVQTLTPAGIVASANGAISPLGSFLESMSELPGFCEDPLLEKAALLAMALTGRPEKFLEIAPYEDFPPLIDNDVMRVLLRLGLISLSDDDAFLNEHRTWVSEETAMSVRFQAYDLMHTLQLVSGLSMAELDFALRSAQLYCSEMSEPDCANCPLAAVCDQKVNLFQPVLRTPAY